MDEKQMLAFLAKAGITTQNTGGLLNAEQAAKFINTVVDSSQFLKEIRVERGIGTARDLDIIGTGSRLLHAPVEDTAPDDDKIKGVITGRRSLCPVEVMLPYNISLKYLEENIEKQGAEQTINSLFSTQFANDLIDLALNGNTKVAIDNPDYSFLKITDAWISHLLSDPNRRLFVRDDSSDWLGQIFSGMLKLLPEKYKANQSDLVFLTNYDAEEEYRAQLASKNTGLGDIFTTSKPASFFKGIPVQPLPYMPYGTVLLTKKSNLALGFGREITVYKMLNPRARRIEYTITAKIDYNYTLTEQIVACI